MGKKPTILLLLTILFVLLQITGCGKEKVQGIYGKWAFIHDKVTTVAIFNHDGTAKYQEKEYSFNCDNEFIKLTDTDGQILQLRYLLNDKGMYLYTNTPYVYQGSNLPTSLVGDWVCQDKNWSFSFKNDGSFMEDGYFPGSYKINEQDSSFHLHYEDQFEDTVCYYQLEQNTVHIEYPWQLVHTVSK